MYLSYAESDHWSMESVVLSAVTSGGYPGQTVVVPSASHPRTFSGTCQGLNPGFGECKVHISPRFITCSHLYHWFIKDFMAHNIILFAIVESPIWDIHDCHTRLFANKGRNSLSVQFCSSWPFSQSFIPSQKKAWCCVKKLALQFCLGTSKTRWRNQPITMTRSHCQEALKNFAGVIQFIHRLQN